MNKKQVLDWLIRDCDEKSDSYLHYLDRDGTPLQELLDELGNRQAGAYTAPSELAKEPGRAIASLGRLYRNSVTCVSLVLNREFPDRYLFYRVSDLERAIFDGLDFLSEIEPSFQLPFQKIGRKGLNNYLALNTSLLEFARKTWPKLKRPGQKILYFLYYGLGQLFSPPNEYNRYWIMVTKPDYFHHLDSKETILDWSGRSDMREGDVVFIYRTAPRSAITDVFRVAGRPDFDPYGAWDGFWVNLRRVGRVDDIPYRDLRDDPVTGEWGLVKRGFVGTVTEPVPYAAYNRILERIGDEKCRKYRLVPEEVPAGGVVGQFSTERHFEDDIVEPIVKQWGFRRERQYLCRVCLGTQYVRPRVDYFVSDSAGPLTVIENKLKIANENELRTATEQAKSYALLLGLPSFVVASPEGWRLFRLCKGQEELVQVVCGEDVKDLGTIEKLRTAILNLRR
ncbi:MAG: EVE domain-containing protein [Acidobacteria bacterium]|nr:MAG: EVE domain-containing protein [Acidobacteriota bacterium]